MKQIIKTILATSCLFISLGASAQMKLTLGHNAAIGNPKHEASVKFADLVKEKSTIINKLQGF